MKKLPYKLTTVSSLIVSPRAALAFYEVLGDFSTRAPNNSSKYLPTDALKVIYPFYQYGLYTAYDPEHTAYYLPGSSIKGALCKKPAASGSLMVDDILIPSDNIVLRNLFKVQYLDDMEKAFYDVFFKNVGVEMVSSGIVLEGTMNLCKTSSIEDIITATNESTKMRIKQMLAYLCGILKKLNGSDLCDKLNETVNNLRSCLEGENIFLLGGYKGLLHSMEVKQAKEQDEISSAVFLDPKTMLPHGLVKIKLL